MFQYLPDYFKNLLLTIGLFLLLSPFLMAQSSLVANQMSTPSKVSAQNHSIYPQSQSLKNVLSDLEKRMKISLNYDIETIKGKNVGVDILNDLAQTKDIETSLKIVLNPFQLSFEKLTDNYYIIVKKPKNKVQKIEKIEKLDLSEPKNEGKKQSNNLKPEEVEKSEILPKTLRSINGKVTDAKGEGIPGVSIFVKNTTNGTTSDSEGKYALNIVDDNSILVFSSVGFIGQEILVGTNTLIDITLKEDIAKLNEVLVIGYGVVEKNDLTGSVGSLKGDDIVKIPASSPEQALAGKIAGVQVLSNSGAPGSVPTIRVRGVGTLNNSSPLFVVDGVFLDDISFLNSADIESMTVLKDASSTAIYGSRGANGVIIITTKRGKEGKASISFNMNYSTQLVGKKLDLLNGQEFASVVNEIFPGTFNNISKVPSTDWQKQIFRSNAPLFTADLGLSGANERINYYIGVGYFKQDGIIPNSSFERLNIKLNNTYNLAKNISLGHNLTISRSLTKSIPNTVATAYRAWPTSVPFTDQGKFAEVRGSGNPLAELAYTNDIRTRIRAVGNIFVQYNFLQDFTFKSSFGLDTDFSKAKNFAPVYFVSPLQQNVTNDLSVENTQNFLWVWENTLSYLKKIGDHQIDALVGYTLQENHFENIKASTENLVREDPEFWYINAGDRSRNQSSNFASNSALMSYLFRVNYTWKNKYLFTITSRMDGSSKFGRNNRYSFFPSVALGWNISEEAFLKNTKWLDNLKLRASWGVIGNEKIDGNAQYALVDNGIDAIFGASEQIRAGATTNKSSNPDLRWESTKQLDVGLELSVLNNRLTAEFDYYQRTTSDILVGLLDPGHIGNGPFVTTIRNAAKVSNKGFEFTINWQQKIGDWSYKIGVLGATVHNEVLSLGTNNNRISDGSLGNGQLVTSTVVGSPIGAFYGYQTMGIFQNEQELTQFPKLGDQVVGDFRYLDRNNDGVITPDDRGFIGSPIPKLTYGFNFNVTYKGFTLNLDFQGQSGNKIYNGKRAVRPELYNFEGNLRNRWQGEGTSNTEPRVTSGGLNYSPSNYFLEKGDFLRLRSVGITYNLPSNWLSKIKLKQVALNLRGTNVFTLTKYTGYTPEIGGGSVTSAGIDLGIYPVTTVYSLGLNVTF